MRMVMRDMIFSIWIREGYKITIEGLSRSFDKEFWNYAKLISGILRHKMPMPYVVDSDSEPEHV